MESKLAIGSTWANHIIIIINEVCSRGKQGYLLWESGEQAGDHYMIYHHITNKKSQESAYSIRQLSTTGSLVNRYYYYYYYYFYG
eukprot:6181186-Pleurochrysis_carterae.AAC.4